MRGVLESRDMGKKKPKKAKKPSSKKKKSPQVTEVETTFPSGNLNNLENLVSAAEDVAEIDPIHFH